MYAAVPVHDTKPWGIVHAGRSHMMPRAYCLQRTEPISAFVRWVECYFRDACVCQLFRDDGEGPVECALDLRAETPVDFHPVHAKPVAFSGKGHPARGIWKRLDNSLKPRIFDEAGEPQKAGAE